ncbi:MAG: cytochrome c-type biogenesis protein CcmH [Afipia sp.]|nr:cytochrome c-type biogenesis protein CcmH [Afipia sp.]
MSLHNRQIQVFSPPLYLLRRLCPSVGVRVTAPLPRRSVSREIVFRSLWVLIAFAFVLATPASAQEQPITDDQVNAVASEMYCPVCENIPLDACGTAACAEWRAEIRDMLAQGWTTDEVKTDFVRRFGDRVVGTPMDPTLRALSIVTPYVLAGLALIAALWTVFRWRMGVKSSAAGVPTMTTTPTPETESDNLRARLERDVAGGTGL